MSGINSYSVFLNLLSNYDSLINMLYAKIKFSNSNQIKDALRKIGHSFFSKFFFHPLGSQPLCCAKFTKDTVFFTQKSMKLHHSSPNVEKTYLMVMHKSPKKRNKT